MGERRTPLLETHRKLGAKLTEFAGWEMPLSYGGGGVIAEHNAVRGAVGVFDVSHLGKLRVSGPGAADALGFAVTADIVSLPVGRARYGLVLTEEGGCVDDVFTYRLGDDEWMVVPNASNVAAVAERIEGPGTKIEDEWARWAILAIQGPRAFEVFGTVFPRSGALDLKLHAWSDIDVFGRSGIVARTGYTGERGFELYAPAEVSEEAFGALIEAGCAPVGLGARDTLRLEMGYALYGHELTLDIDPLEAGLGWAVSWDTPFRGRDALQKIRAEGPARTSVGIVCTQRGVPRQGYQLFLDDRPIGTVTSGNHSPTLNTGIALALVDGGKATAVPPGAEVAIDARGRRLAGDIVEPPFVKRR
jgi:aminomethyltransferase